MAVPGSGLCLLGVHDDTGYLGAGDWQVGAAYCWLFSDRHFVEDQEQPHRQEMGTEVINDSHFFDITKRATCSTPKMSMAPHLTEATPTNRSRRFLISTRNKRRSPFRNTHPVGP